MRVLIVGATGYVGGHLTRRLLGAGHHVTATARTPTAAHRLRETGVEAVAGDAHHPTSLVAAAAGADAVVYAAAASSFDADHDAVAALVAAMGRTGATVVFTSGSAVVADRAGGAASAVVHGDGPPDHPPPEGMRRRVDIEEMIIRAGEHGARGLVLRPPLVYGHGGSFQVPLMIQIARVTGRAQYVGAGLNRWSTVHVDDLADLYLLALDRGAGGRVYNAGAGEVTMRELADAVGTMLGTGPATTWTPEAAAAHGPMTAGFGSNSRLDSSTAVQELGWRPHRPGVIHDLLYGSYKRGP